MNEQQKPLSTEQIAGGRQTPEADERHMNESSIEQTQARTDVGGVKDEGRAGLESTYSESRMSGDGSNPPALMPVETAQAHRKHWTDIQVRFVDDPHDAVEEADELVAEVMQTVASRFAEQRKSLENQWQGGGDADSEDLRQALLQYRSFFERLLAA